MAKAFVGYSFGTLRKKHQPFSMTQPTIQALSKKPESVSTLTTRGGGSCGAASAIRWASSTHRPGARAGSGRTCNSSRPASMRRRRKSGSGNPAFYDTTKNSGSVENPGKRFHPDHAGRRKLWSGFGNAAGQLDAQAGGKGGIWQDMQFQPPRINEAQAEIRLRQSHFL